ncbi:surfeit locus protein 6 homolog [Cydia pomonella]|uniref:surfeit locus protein 6 homolog n=1 Tax=Cydia pomonella TaxID=82600 RepID=UPI002ADDB7F7|nr:surfeit locus protein 6 homolog [Cydia pomonella]
MSIQKKPIKSKQLKMELNNEFIFLQNIFSVLSIPQQTKDEFDDVDIEITNGDVNQEEKKMPKRVTTIAELEERLEKIKSQHNFHLKTKLAKKSLASKLNKKIKKRDRINKTKVKPSVDKPILPKKEHKTEHAAAPKPIFNNEAKLVFSKFDFANTGQKERVNKGEKDPKKILENLKQQEEKFRQLEESEETSKVKELKEKIAWKNMLQKAEGQKIKDDPSLLKKSIQKREQKKKHSKKQWDNRIQNVKETKDARQAKRTENIAKKKKEKKSKNIKQAVKRGRVVI